MKTIFFTLIVLFSFSNINGQELASQNSETNTINIEASKTDFFQALIEKNNFDIKIKNNRKGVSVNTKGDFYNLLLEKNGFQSKPVITTKLTDNNDVKKATTKEAAILVTLLP
ncbi:hypothetical protein [Aquimarina sp. 2201CG5-10]|uniref:hypothetical protein n=1 Tax=Aquimarina callyspongiae TaxID=3098150 RepID=UPI002AB40E8A|nr:hypothetical protein [Aquimarina sp. 2201CG5-10]MDY8134222.1 hypothetical protein [Aquimarina sp. 2201CG5-10]